MSNHTLFVCRRKAALASIPRDVTSREWGELQRAFAAACGARDPDREYVGCVTLYPDQYHAGVFYAWGPAGPDGAWFELYQLPHHTEADIKRCRNHLRASRDVASMVVRRVSEWVPVGEAGLGEYQLDPQGLQITSNAEG